MPKSEAHRSGAGNRKRATAPPGNPRVCVSATAEHTLTILGSDSLHDWSGCSSLASSLIRLTDLAQSWSLESSEPAPPGQVEMTIRHTSTEGRSLERFVMLSLSKNMERCILISTIVGVYGAQRAARLWFQVGQVFGAARLLRREILSIEMGKWPSSWSPRYCFKWSLRSNRNAGHGYN